MQILIKWMLLAICWSALSGCSGLMNYVKHLQGQPIEDLSKRSREFIPQFQFEAPRRQLLTPEQQREIGAPPPLTGDVVLDGIRYYSANGHVCQSFRHRSGDTAMRSACFIDGRWVLTVPVLNSVPVPSRR